jgi:hypothetical protein
MRKYSLLLLVCAGALLWAQNVNFSGRWAMPGGRGGQTVLTLNQVGTQVFGGFAAPARNGGTGAPVNQEILDGKVNGNVITFYVWTGNDVPAKQMYKGTMSGDEITWEITGGPARGGGGGRGASGRGPAAPAGPPISHRVK